MVILALLLGLIPENVVKRRLANLVLITTFRILARSFSAVITNHNHHNKPRSDGICVANHTTPVDIVVLACDNSYSYVSLSSVSFAYCGSKILWAFLLCLLTYGTRGCALLCAVCFWCVCVFACIKTFYNFIIHWLLLVVNLYFVSINCTFAPSLLWSFSKWWVWFYQDL